MVCFEQCSSSLLQIPRRFSASSPLTPLNCLKVWFDEVLPDECKQAGTILYLPNKLKAPTSERATSKRRFETVDDEGSANLDTISEFYGAVFSELLSITTHCPWDRTLSPHSVFRWIFDEPLHCRNLQSIGRGVPTKNPTKAERGAPWPSSGCQCNPLLQGYCGNWHPGVYGVWLSKFGLAVLQWRIQREWREFWSERCMTIESYDRGWGDIIWRIDDQMCGATVLQIVTWACLLRYAKFFSSLANSWTLFCWQELGFRQCGDR